MMQFHNHILAACAFLASARAATNPSGFVLSSTFADPRSLLYDGTYYAFATNNQNSSLSEPVRNVPVATSKSFSTGWTYSTADVLPHAGAWTASNPAVWDPSVFSYNSSHFVMYYAATPATETGTHCIGVATATSVLGTYTPQRTPLICDNSGTLYISPNPFLYKGTPYFVHKAGNQGNSSIRLQQLSADGTALVGSGVQLLHATGSELDTEGPVMTFNPQDSGRPIVLFVTGYFQELNYKIQYAVAPTAALVPPSGQSYVVNDTPLLQTGVVNGQQLYGPGGPDFPSLAHSVYEMTFMADRNNQTYMTRSMRTATLTYYANNTLAVV